MEDDNMLVEVDSKCHNDLITIMKGNHRNIMQSHTEDRFQFIFWKDQFYASQQKLKALLDSYGFSFDLDNQLINDLYILSLEDYQKHISLIGYEIYIKENLVFNKVTGELVGFCDVGDINNHLLLEESYKRDGTEVNDMHHWTPTLAKTMLMITVQGLFTNFTFPYASFPSTNLTGEQLVPIFLEALTRLEVCGIRVMSITLDRCSVNRKFLKTISDNSGKIKCKFNNPLSNGQRQAYVFPIPRTSLKQYETVKPIPKRICR
uniref:Transposable element P transposase-like RNase H domain-containing protein n=1 Tax=Amphimedon queenslandica TaxID=400682 RepID=A0A1X7TDM4_AMPQE